MNEERIEVKDVFDDYLLVEPYTEEKKSQFVTPGSDKPIVTNIGIVKQKGKNVPADIEIGDTIIFKPHTYIGYKGMYFVRNCDLIAKQ